ncbi:hypothetical protein IY145_00575 [Methylosinus sp. H3A]|uniref:hypothetical protein n=1 Tax=Methylosinus sp. H3A TaxID=2785786 RepID=UPI0018C30C2C|nr:hypothetical protein [Methylosinus sp. H3A]MBG0807927.1 hypothetical protein [Methylosinus sp. H3A]
MGKTISSALPTVAVDYDATLIMAVETSNKSWVEAAHVPGLGHIKAKQTIDPAAEALATSIEGYRRRAATFGKDIDRVIVVYEAWEWRLLAGALSHG